MKSIFSKLLRARINSDEDYLTVCFAELLKLWNESDSNSLREFIQCLTGNNIRIEGKLIEITTQKMLENFGTPDIWIRFSDSLILMENKWLSPPNASQIARYYDFLKQRREKIQLLKTSLVFVSPRHYGKPWIQWKEPDNEITWIEISGMLKESINKLSIKKLSALTFYKSEFIKFLEDHNMSEKPISWQYMEGVPALLNLLEMIWNVLSELKEDGKVTEISISHGQNWAGCYFFSPDGQNKFWFGQPFDGNYKRLLFTAEELKTWPHPKDGFEQYEPWRKKHSKSFDFKDKFFFSRDKIGQKEILKEFIKNTLEIIEAGNKD